MTRAAPFVPPGERGHRLPAGFGIELRSDVQRADGGRVLIGGSPARVIRLGGRAASLLARDTLTVEDGATEALARRLLDGNLADPVVRDVRIPASELTVVVPVRDRADQLDRCLAALVPLRVLVVDDASRSPASVRDVAELHGADLVVLARNVGPAGARNAGLAEVATALVAFVDSDVVVSSEDLLRLARHTADPRVALVGPLVAGEVRSERPRWFERYDARASSLDLGPIAYRVGPGAGVAWLPAACLVGRVSLLGGGFDERMRVAEDVDLVWRLEAAGWTVRYDPAVRVGHDCRTTVRAWLGRKLVYGTGGAALAARHGDKVAPAVLSPAMAVAGAALLVRRRWSLPAAGLVLAVTSRSIARTLPVERHRTVVAVRLAGRGIGWAVRQESALLLRHWWPLSPIVARTRAGRRALLTAVVVDAAILWRDRPETTAADLLARRLDDVAYGAGLWCGALRGRSARCLGVRRSGPQRTGRTAAAL